MRVIQFPERTEWRKIMMRPVADTSSLEMTVSNILKEVRENGDDAVRRFSLMFDKVSIENAEITQKEIGEANSLVSDELKSAIQKAKKNIEFFHKQQLQPVEMIEPMAGVQCWRKTVPIEKVGLYIPGGTAPLFSTLLMLGIPARLAGCKEIVLCSPPDQEGKLHPAILYSAELTGISKIFKIGGVQAIAAMAYGTTTVPQVYKIFGPGNQYVTCAKQMVQKEGLAIDIPAGPSEVAIYADQTADPAFVAADLLSQAEHGVDSQVILVSTAQSVIDHVLTELENQIKKLERKTIAEKSLANSKAVLVKTQEEAIDLLNEYAPEHLILACRNPEKAAAGVMNAGSVFLGNYSPESVGDYASGTNHVLPTNGYARSYSGVSMDSFVKRITFQQLTPKGLENIGKAVITMAEAEGLQAHANAIRVRLDKK
ncbi:MAG TPA: histidinol dehydrogenase [Puia sp.]|nr:histidinol dehydrogenase [Puia sp.]